MDIEQLSSQYDVRDLLPEEAAERHDIFGEGKDIPMACRRGVEET